MFNCVIATLKYATLDIMIRLVYCMLLHHFSPYVRFFDRKLWFDILSLQVLISDYLISSLVLDCIIG